MKVPYRHSLNIVGKSIFFLTLASLFSLPAIAEEFNVDEYFANFKPKYQRKDCIIGFEYRDRDTGTGERWPHLFSIDEVMPFLKKHEPKASFYQGGTGRQITPGWQTYYMQFADQCDRRTDIATQIADHLMKTDATVEIRLLPGPFTPGRDSIDAHSKGIWLPDD